MNETTLYLAQVMGPVLLLVGVAFGVHNKFCMEWLGNLKENGQFLFLAAIVEFVAGLSIVLHHNLWETPVEIIITLMAYGMILEGASLLLGGKDWTKYIVRLASHAAPAFMFVAVLCIALGGYLSWVAYLA